MVAIAEGLTLDETALAELQAGFRGEVVGRDDPSYDEHRKVWVAKPLAGQAIRTSHARLITGSDNATSTVWKDRFLCFWFYTPNTGEGLIHG